MSDQYVCGYVIEFNDGGPPEAQVLHVGDKEACQKVADSIPAVAYSGDRPVKHATVRVRPQSVPGSDGDSS